MDRHYKFRIVILLVIVSCTTAGAAAQTFTTLFDFNGKNGQNPYFEALTQATNGNLYGTTYGGGVASNGTIFKISTDGKFTLLHSFCSVANCADGKNPWAGVIQAADGQLYGTTQAGGVNNGGSVFRLSLGGKLTTLYSFCAMALCADGESPVAGLVQGTDGLLYGTTYGGGATGAGTIFSISTSGAFKTLYSFCSQALCADGSNPYGGLVQQGSGQFYGTTYYGGAHNSGSVFAIAPRWKLWTLHSFCSQTNCADGGNPHGTLIQSVGDNFYGTTEFGGASGHGTIFTLGPSGYFSNFYSFSTSEGDPTSSLIAANDGNLYGTTWSPGTAGNGGLIFSIDYAAHYTARYNFCTTATDCTGEFPFGGLLQATDGSFYGATNNGGTNGAGTVYRFADGLPAFVKLLPDAAKVGARINILGNHLTMTTSVKFNGTAANFSVVSDTQVAATVPIGATFGAVEVTTPGGILESNPFFEVLF